MKQKNYKKTPYILVIIRLLPFLRLILNFCDKRKMSFNNQLKLGLTIVISDIFDGIISRKYMTSDYSKLNFRIIDTLVDKTGITLSLISLLKKNKISKELFDSIMTHNTLLITLGSFNLILNDKKYESISSNMLSRIYTLFVGITCILFENDILNKEDSEEWTNLMITFSKLVLKSQVEEKMNDFDVDDVFVKRL